MNILSATFIIQSLEFNILSLYICFRSNMSKIVWEVTSRCGMRGDDPHGQRPGYRSFLVYVDLTASIAVPKALNPI